MGEPRYARTLGNLQMGVGAQLGLAAAFAGFTAVLANVSVPYAPEPALGLSAPYLWEILCGLLVVAAHVAYYLLVARRERNTAQREALEQTARIERQLAAHR